MDSLAYKISEALPALCRDDVEMIAQIARDHGRGLPCEECERREDLDDEALAHAQDALQAIRSVISVLG